jgi:hypothetical protein
MPLKFVAAAAKSRSRENAVMKRSLITICFGVLIVSAALAKEKKAVPPPPKPTDEGPSLEDTMKFIQDKVSGLGPVRWVGYCRDNDNDWTTRNKAEATNVVANASTCQVSLHVKVERDGKVIVDIDGGFLMKNVADVAVMPQEQLQKEADTAGGYPEYSCRFDPRFRGENNVEMLLNSDVFRGSGRQYGVGSGKEDCAASAKACGRWP